MRRLLATLFVCVLGWIAGPAHAAVCNPAQSPFTDVPDASSFCTEVLWLRNALVTSGCAATLYCPSDPVTRAQMALFMRRLARALTPDILYAEQGGGPGDLDTGYPLCTTTLYAVPAGGNPRILLSAAGNISLLTDATADVFVNIQWSANGAPYVALGGMFALATVPGNQWTTIPIQWSQSIQGGSGALLSAGTNHQFRINARRNAGSTTGDVSASRCHLKIDLPVDAAS